MRVWKLNSAYKFRDVFLCLIKSEARVTEKLKHHMDSKPSQL